MKFLFCSALAGLLTFTQVHAAPVELAASTDGSGTVEAGSSGDRVSKANLVLKRDGRFTLGLVGGRDTRFSGTWQPSGRDNVLLKLNEVDGKDARGSGQVDLRSRRGDYEVDRILITGESDRGRSINVQFNAPRYVAAPVPPPPPAPRRVLDAERDGSGRLQVAGRENYRLNHARVQLFTDGSARVRAQGTGTLTYEGSWTQSGDTAATLTVRGGIDGERLQGIVRYRDGRFWRVELTGTHASRYYSLEFEPGR